MAEGVGRFVNHPHEIGPVNRRCPLNARRFAAKVVVTIQQRCPIGIIEFQDGIGDGTQVRGEDGVDAIFHGSELRPILVGRWLEVVELGGTVDGDGAGLPR